MPRPRDLEIDHGPNTISRENVQRKIVAEATVAGRDLGSAVAVGRGSMERLSPIFMTALTAGFALLPLALGGGEPALFWQLGASRAGGSCPR